MNSESYIKQELEQLQHNDNACIYTSQELQNNVKNKTIDKFCKVIGQGIDLKCDWLNRYFSIS